MRVGEAVEAFLAVRRARSAAATIRAYAGVLNQITDQIGGRPGALGTVGDDELAAARA